MKNFILGALFFLFALPANAQSYKETFDTNSLEWTECAYKNAIGTAVIDKGVMTITSKGELKGLGLLAGKKIRENTFFETHCYAPIDVMKPFEISAKVNIKQLASDRLVGLVFNYRDNGNFYCFSFNDDFVSFRRFEDGDIVGEVSQGIKWSQKRREDMDWTLTSDGDTLVFKIDGVSILTIRYMPLSYAGVGFYTYGNQELVVDEIEFRQ
ncbi:hypothetical protein [uncultured Alistipes sp.]|uniref:hypothetical protein n=1 Tax=uncultured Alistipes sp. TaxID=538949 RepID=UPI0025F0DE33|nr:hypothetical protein [uncultured Alistipes sp.]